MSAHFYHLAIAWNWEYDRGFLNCIKSKAGENNISLLEISKENVEFVLEQLKNKNISFKNFLDRASDEDESFQPLVQYLKTLDTDIPYQINPPHLQQRAADKATMHLEFLSNGIEVPYTIIISPYTASDELQLSVTDLAKLGRPFIIKPANTTGGGIGVVTGAETLREVLEARQCHKNDKYLLQETIHPKIINGKRAWFRVFYAFGNIFPCWWDDQTHIYATVETEEELRFSLQNLRQITANIQKICRLDFFSTELVYTSDGRCVAVDYVNEMCDMRLQSQAYDGVPDAVVEAIVISLINFVKKDK